MDLRWVRKTTEKLRRERKNHRSLSLILSSLTPKRKKLSPKRLKKKPASKVPPQRGFTSPSLKYL